MIRYILLFLFGLILISCEEKSKEITAEVVVENAIQNACSNYCDNARISFIFRKKKYISYRENGNYEYIRSYSDSTGDIKDVLNNEGFKRFRNDTVVQLQDTTIRKLTNSVNSVHYFFMLPFNLRDEAANKTYLGDDIVQNKKYYEIKVTFDKEGGGDDFQDVFIYWIHKIDYTVDYLAYSYETDGGGMRFREAINPRTIEGIRFVDYRNYKPTKENVSLNQLDDLFEEGKLELLSLIENEEIKVELPDGKN